SITAKIAKGTRRFFPNAFLRVSFAIFAVIACSLVLPHSLQHVSLWYERSPPAAGVLRDDRQAQPPIVRRHHEVRREAAGAGAEEAAGRAAAFRTAPAAASWRPHLRGDHRLGRATSGGPRAAAAAAPAAQGRAEDAGGGAQAAARGRGGHAPGGACRAAHTPGRALRTGAARRKGRPALSSAARAGA